MIISRKKFNEAIKEAQNAECEARARMYEEQQNKKDLAESFYKIDRRMNKAFEDIDRRLTALEASRPAEAVAWCPKY